jgi:ribonuclease PH
MLHSYRTIVPGRGSDGRQKIPARHSRIVPYEYQKQVPFFSRRGLSAPRRNTALSEIRYDDGFFLGNAKMANDSAQHLRRVAIQRNYTAMSPGSVLYQAGNTIVLCTASVDPKVPDWLAGKGKGWITAEYNMLPHSTSPRKAREREKLDGRTTEIQRLIGRSLRAVADLRALGERAITVDCDVLQADGGTRTASVTGAFIALVDAIRSVQSQLPDPARFPLADSVAAISVGIVDGRATLDLNYAQDVDAEVDMNVVMTGRGRYIEIQGTGEEATFGDEDLAALLALARQGIVELTAIQRQAMGNDWPL